MVGLDIISAKGVLTSGAGSAATFDIGTHTEVYTVTDQAGNTDQCSFTITVNDTEAPTPNCPADITQTIDPGQCGANVSFTIPNPDDNCPGASSLASPISGEFFNIGTTQVTVTATDAAGNTNQCTFNVVVNDNIAPMAICPGDITQTNDAGQCGASISFNIPDPTDNCTVATSMAIPASGSFFGTGTTQVTVTATDAGGNTDQCTFNVMVNDIEAPSIVCPFRYGSR